MTTPAISALEALTERRGFNVFLEYESTNGVADIVLAQFDDSAVRLRAGGVLSGTYCDRVDIAVLLGLEEEREQTPEDIAQSSALSTSTVTSRLRSLAARGVATRTESHRWLRCGPFPCRLAEAIAVELKLSDWRRALDQAARYRAFADRTVVVISDRHRRAASKKADAFAFNRVGLMALSVWAQAEMIIEPEVIPPFDPVARFVAGERLWRDLQHRWAAT